MVKNNRKALLLTGIIIVLGSYSIILILKSTTLHLNTLHVLSVRNKLDADLDTILRLADKFHTLHGRYPKSMTEIATAIHPCKLPKDPWSNPYVYEIYNGKPRVKCLGWDGREGGIGGAEVDISKP